MQNVNLESIDKLSKKELKRAVLDCFEHARDASPIDRLAVLQEAQFYSRELERRADSRTSIRDLILEVIVIGLIGWEIFLGYKTEKLQSAASEKELGVLNNLQTSSQNTATILQSLNATTDTMNAAIQDEANLNYKVAVDVTYDTGVNRLIVSNNGRTPVWVWGIKLGDSARDMDREPHVIPAGGHSYMLVTLYDTVVSKTPDNGRYEPTLDLYLRSEDRKPYVVHSLLSGLKNNGWFSFHATTLSITQKDWSKP